MIAARRLEDEQPVRGHHLYQRVGVRDRGLQMHERGDAGALDQGAQHLVVTARAQCYAQVVGLTMPRRASVASAAKNTLGSRSCGYRMPAVQEMQRDPPKTPAEQPARLCEVLLVVAVRNQAERSASRP